MKLSYISYLEEVCKECEEFREEYEAFVDLLRNLDRNQLNMVTIAKKAEEIDDIVNNIKERLNNAAIKAEQDLLEEDYHRGSCMKLLRALNERLVPKVSYTGTLFKKLATTNQDELDIDRIVGKSGEQCKPFTVAELNIDETMQRLAEIETGLERLVPIAEALMEKHYCWTEVTVELAIGRNKIGDIGLIRYYLGNTMVPIWGLALDIDEENTQSDTVISSKSKLLGALYTAHGAIVSWLKNAEHFDWIIINIAQMELELLRYCIEAEINLISTSDDISQIFGSLDNFEHAIIWHGSLLTAIMKAEAVEQRKI